MEKTDIYDTIIIQQRVLEAVACWPKENKSKFYSLRFYFCWVLELILFVMIIMELIKMIRDREYLALTEMLSFFVTQISYLVKKLIFGLKQKKFLKTLAKLKRTSFSNYPQQSDKHVITTITYTQTLIRSNQLLCVGLILSFALKPLLNKNDLPLRFSLVELGKLKIAMHIFQVCCVAYGSCVHITIDGLAIGLIAICSAQFQILNDKLVNIRNWAGFTYEQIDQGKINSDSEINEELDASVQKRLRECVIHHQDIIELVDDIEDFYTFYFLVQFGDSVLAICNTWFQFKMVNDLINMAFLIIYSLALLIQLGVFCLYGNLLIDKSEEILSACYMSDWYNCGAEVRKTLMIIMERSKRPSVLTAGKLSPLSLASFRNLLQASYSYLAIMNNLNE